jgi:hypothetical protein
MPPFLRPLLLFLALVAATSTGRTTGTPQFVPLATPAAPGSLAPHVATAGDGTVWMSWLEPLAKGEHRLMGARFDATRSIWLDPFEIARGQHWFINWADTPQITAGDEGHLAAVWYVRQGAEDDGHGHGHGYGGWVAFSADRGQTWSQPGPLSQESPYTEFASVLALPNGRWLAIWLDGRAKHHGGPMQLFGRELGGESTADQLLDDRVCDCCPTTLIRLPDGSAYGVYRGRTADEIRDLGGVRWRDGRWTRATGLPADGWKIAGCPVNGPVLTRLGSRLGLAWFTGAADQPRVLAAVSNDFAIQWPTPQRLDRPGPASPQGRVGATLLRDGHLWVSYLDAAGGVVLAQLPPGGEPILHPLPHGRGTSPSRSAGIPRLVWLAQAPGAAPRLLLVRTETEGDGGIVGLSTTLVVLSAPPSAKPAASAVTLSDDCGCDHRRGTPEGHAVRGRIVQLLPEQQSVLVAHEEVPGVMRAMTMAFRVDPRLLQLLRPDQEVIGRMVRRDDNRWWLFNVRVVPPTENVRRSP